MFEDTMRSYYVAYNAEDEDRLAAHLAEDVVLTSAAGTTDGRESYLATYRFMIGAFVDRMTPVSIQVSGDIATVRIEDRLTARADIPDFMGQRIGKGETIMLDLIGRYSFRDGKIAKIEISSA